MLNLTDVHQEVVRLCGGVIHDPEAHNTCVLIVEKGSGLEAFWSYSNPSSLPAATKRRLKSTLIPNELPPNSLLRSVGRIRDGHTERRLLNYVESIGKLSGNATFITTRNVCASCMKGIWEAQRILSSRCSLRAFQLGAENPGKVLDSATLMTFKKSSEWRHPDKPELVDESPKINFV